MKSLKYWAFALGMDAFVFGLFYLWLSKGMEGAANTLSFVLWALIILKTIAAFGSNKEAASKYPRPFLANQYTVLSVAAKVILLAWVAYTWTATCYLIATVLVEASRVADLKPKKEA